ncbi:hypothetical protein [Paenirhodobacter populi]|uniref:hypothetical protein n=1 Tax=Paenirhodobacter populi TaxID=2306993 RepID=UPI0019D41801|nr:hypothetical protein [Sinirhodobacter populi]
MNVHNPNVTQRAALYLRVSTPRQAEHAVSIPDQRKQGEARVARRAATSWSKSSSNRATQPPTTADPSFNG